jgi:hypothetical protein
MALPRKDADVPQEEVATPCAICGRASECEAWGFPLCYGEHGRQGCATKLWLELQEAPPNTEKETTIAWVSEQKRKGRAA